MKVYQTNACLGYWQLAFIIKIKDNDYMCIGLQNVNNDTTYRVGDMVYELESYYVEPSKFKIEESELYGNFLFDHFITNFKG